MTTWSFLETALEDPVEIETSAGLAVALTRPRPSADRANEDGVAIVELGDAVVFILADGVGGAPNGQLASRTAIKTLTTTLENAPNDTRDSGIRLRDVVLSGIERANDSVLALGTGSATTLVVVTFEQGSIRSYHVGDSIALVTGQRGLVKFQTIPHSPVGYLIEAGALDEDQARTHEDLHIVSNLVGSTDMSVTISSPLELAPRDTVLLASDGLMDNLYSSEIVETVRSGPLLESASTLSELAQQRMSSPEASELSKPDDLSFVLFRIG